MWTTQTRNDGYPLLSLHFTKPSEANGGEGQQRRAMLIPPHPGSPYSVMAVWFQVNCVPLKVVRVLTPSMSFGSEVSADVAK